MSETRRETRRLLEMVDEGAMDPMMALHMCLDWMDEAEVADMMSGNNLTEEDLDYENDDEEPEEDTDE